MNANVIKTKFFSRRGRAGFTLVEVLVTVLIYMLVAAAGYMVLSSGMLSWQVNNTRVELQQELRKAMDWMVLDLRQAGPSSVSSPSVSNTWATSITFRVAVGASGGVVVWSTEQYRYYLGGTNNRQLRRQDLTTGTVKEIAQDISVLQVRRPLTAQDTVEISLTAAKQTSLGGMISQTMDFAVQLRN